MRSYLVVLDESEESRVALRYASRRAIEAGCTVEILALVPPQEFVPWGGVQAAMEEEARLRAEAMVLEASGAILEEAGIRPAILVRDHGRFLRIDVDQRLAALRAWNKPVWWPIGLLAALVLLLIWGARRQLNKRERMNARGEVLV